MLNKIKKYRFILIKDDDLYAKELKVRDMLLPFLIVSLFIFSFATVIIFSKDFKDIISLKVISHHKKNNADLNLVIEEQKKTINHLVNSIDSIHKQDETLRRLINLPAIDQDIRKLGVGGTERKDKFNHLEYLIPGNIDLDNIDKKIDYIKRSINLERMSYSKISVEIIKNKEFLLSYPAIYPVFKEKRKLSSRYDYRRDPFTKKRQFHYGDDFSAKIGTEVLATANGTVKSSKYYGSFGHYIEIDHGNGYVTVYAHLSKRMVRRGDKVTRGDIIAEIGNTGKSTAAHLHYEVKLNGNHVNPNQYYFN